MIIASRILRIGKSPISGLEYTNEVLEEIVQKWKDSSTFVVLKDETDQSLATDFLDLTQICGIIKNLFVDDEGLVAEIEVLDTPNGIILSEKVESEKVASITPNLTGSVKDGKVDNPTLLFVSVSVKPE